MAKYLDNTGLQTLVDNIYSHFALKSDIEALSNALVYKGTLASDGTGTVTSLVTTTYKEVGEVYVCSVAGSYATYYKKGGLSTNTDLEVGDMCILKTAVGDSSAMTELEWTVVQNNLIGAVTSSSTLDANSVILGGGGKTITKLTPSKGYLTWTGTAYSWISPESYALPVASTTTLGGVKVDGSTTAGKYIKTPSLGDYSSTQGLPILFTTGYFNGATDGTQSVTIPNATTSKAGLMTTADKSKLDGIATGATKVTVDTSLSTTSTNAISNSAVATALNNITSIPDSDITAMFE